MLTIQPNFTPHSNKALTFKSGYTVNTAEDRKFQEKTQFYEEQANEFDSMIKDNKTPDYMKKVFKTFKVVSEALFEGWLVMWGASKGSKFVKDGVIKGANSKFTKELKEIFKPISKGLKTARTTFAKSINEGADKFKNSEFLKKMNENFIGKQIVKVFEFIGKGFAAVGKVIKSGYDKVASHFKGKSASEIYDKAAKATGRTLGVGAGAAGAYDAATRPDGKKQAESKNETDYNSNLDEDFEDEYNIEDGE